MKKLSFFFVALVALSTVVLFAADGAGSQTASRISSASASESSSLLSHTARLGIVPTIKISWNGRGFLCLKNGSTCKVEIGVGLTDGTADLPTGAPVGSFTGVIRSLDGAPVTPQPGILFGGRIIHRDELRYENGSMYHSDINVPEQTVEFNPALGGYVFYYVPVE